MKTVDECTNVVFSGDALQVIPQLPNACVDCIVTSPPYFGQRDYEAEHQIGSETTPDEYIAALVQVFSQCLRVLKDSGSLWLNLGDKYVDGNLLGMPWRVALALQSHGWILRNDIIWHKPNAMPNSVKNRLTVDHEYIFFLTKRGAEYFYDQDAIREEHVTFSEHSKMRGGRGHFGKRGGTPEEGKNRGNSNLHTARWDQAFHPNGRNKRTVWNVPLSKFRGAHFAVFPEKLIEPCILAGCPETGLVFDPFFGAGTTGVVARTWGRRFLGVEANPQYAEMARQRIANVQPQLINGAKGSRELKQFLG
jgi:DNA modification methylase